MENIEVNQKAVRILAEWDPFKIGPENYDTETADVVAALQGDINSMELARVIQQVYEYSYEKWIPINECEEIADRLMTLKLQISCDI